jgi:DNA polymerase elongation subunit (family B)
MMWEAEKVYDTFIQLGKKKRYAGNIAWKEGTYYSNPNVSISGFEFRRSDSPEVTADLQKKVIEMILLSANFKDVSAYVQSVIEDIDEDHPDVKKFALPGSINKDLEDYPNRQVPRASMYSNEHLGYEFGEGDSPFVYMVKDTPPGLPQTDVVAFEWNEDIPEGFKFDKEAIIERAIRKPIAPIINEVDWKFSEIREGEKAQQLDIDNDTSNPFQ